MRYRRLVPLVALICMVAACGDKGASELKDSSVSEVAGASKSPLRSLGIHFNPETGLLVLTGSDVATTPGQYPDLGIAFSDVGPRSLSEVPATCRGGYTYGDPMESPQISTKLQYRPSGGGAAPLGREWIISWVKSEITLRDCGALDGIHLGQVGNLPAGGAPAELADDGRIWEVIPILPSKVTGLPPSLPVRLPAQLSASTSYESDQTWIAPIDLVDTSSEKSPKPISPIAKPVEDPLADEYLTFTARQPRSLVDRRDDRVEPAQIKVIYAVPSFASDRRRDTSGEIARTVFAVNEWWAAQNAGFGLRFDTSGGALDVGYMTFTMTKQAWYDTYFGEVGPDANFRNGMSRFQTELVRAGYWVGPQIKNSDDSAGQEAAKSGKLFLVIFEAPAGTYARTGVNSGGCRSIIDAINDRVPIIGVAVSDDDLASCGALDFDGRYDATTDLQSQQRWVASKNGFIDNVAQWMRNLPGCGSPETPKDGERVKIPGVGDESKAWEIRGGFMRDLAEPSDPLSDAFSRGSPIARSPTLDPRHDLYFHITSDKLASRAPCNSDISRNPLWDDRPLDADANLGLPRTSYDRPDDLGGAQVKAVYATRLYSKDRRFDVTGEIDSAMSHMKVFIETSTGGANSVRLDTFGGRLDVMYFPVPASVSTRDPATCVDRPCPNEATIFEAMTKAGRVVPDKQYIIFFDGGIEFGGQGLCGGSGQGRASLINLKDITSEQCANLQFASASHNQWSVGLLALHEMFHALGAVCQKAANEGDGMHSTTAGDLMGARAQGRVQLDPGRTYWFQAPSGCNAISKNPLFGRLGR